MNVFSHRGKYILVYISLHDSMVILLVRQCKLLSFLPFLQPVVLGMNRLLIVKNIINGICILAG